jgi:hypothetical protein
MPLAKPLMTLALCFGLGLGLAPTLRTAHACSCDDNASWQLELEQITGDGDPAVEAAFWPAEASLGDQDTLYLGVGNTLVLERQP